MSMSGWWFSLSASAARRSTNATAAGKLSNSSSRTSALSAARHPAGMLIGMTMPEAPANGRLARSRKSRQGKDLLCEWVFRPAAHVVVLALLPLRVPPPAVVLAGAGVGLAGAVEIGRHQFLLAAILLQAKTVLDNADGQLARLSGRVTAFGRYLDSESDLVVNAAIFVALGTRIGPWLALAGFVMLTFVLSVNFNIERLYRRE